MSKTQLTENRLYQIIQESIDEVLQEKWVKGAGLATNLGNTFGNAAGKVVNGINNFKNAAQNAYQTKVKTGTSFTPSTTTNTTGGGTTPNGTTDTTGGGTTNGKSPMPKVNTNQAASQKKNWAIMGQQQQARQNAQQKVNAEKQQQAKYLMSKGFRLSNNGQWIYTKDGSNSPAFQSQYPDIVLAAQKYTNANNQLATMRESKMDTIISKSIKKVLKENTFNGID